MTSDDLQLLRAARIGYQYQLNQLDDRIAQLTGQPARKPPASESFRVQPRKMSASSRKRMADAQRKRRAEESKGKTPAIKVKPARRELSAEGKERIAAATRKRWAEYRAKKAGQAAKGKRDAKVATAGA